MQIKQIYEKYQIMPQLATHMLRVAGVGKLILNGWKVKIDQDLVIRTLLLHDMGNIAKFDLSVEGQKKFISIESENLEYWRKLQEVFWNKYGKDTHGATNAIVAELGQLDVLAILNEEYSGYTSGDESQILRQSDAAQILAYCDVRVTPSGVVPMKERITDLHKRYGRELSWYDFLYKLEEQVREQTTIDLDSIDEHDVEPLFDELLEYRL
ncbi:hypothetical protein COT87_01950 [Candidatus Collierbacteria bacterium CG10_big_fil_rev_8_21_14_0_10_44_9]|uniref:HD domain-containing protein n=1 Tax=Candidatus Collierbacteria bacterium CG10_big_fil_rev_8_21_14_0_10_44_9 TaxID=1974535 RepID=A0A2H0VIM8_9BACT|nr:MAG: hypothetical protein COT87_01950 [Candidatus Collierbacteria bacterium CG10_big_fil_rev_8_21_14_0_10_44_9]